MPAAGYTPKGEIQTSDSKHVDHEWVDQGGGGITGDDFHGTLTWKLGDFYAIADY